MKHIKLVVYLFPFCLLAQTGAVNPATSGQPTAEATETALRESVKGFYELQVQGKFRQAEAFVCADSQETYYALPKRKPASAELGSLKIAEDLKSATVSELLEQNLLFGDVERKVKLPAVSHWKLVDQQWCFFIPPASSTADTPFGKMDFSGGGNSAAGSDASKVAPEAKPQIAVPDAKLVVFSKRTVSLPFEADGSDEIEVTNNLPGPVQFQVTCPEVPGLVCKFDQTMLKAGERTKFHVDFKFDKTPLTTGKAVQIQIDPFESRVSVSIARLEAAKPQE